MLLDRLDRHLKRLPVPAGVFGTLRREARLLVAVLVVAASAWFFVGLVDEVLEGDTHAFDRAVLLAMRDPADRTLPYGSLAFQEAVRDVTALGSVLVVTLVTGIAVGFLVLSRRRRAALLVTAAIAGGGLLSTVLKEMFQRARPDLVPRGMEVFTASFPSGHAMLSAVTYLTLGALLMRLEPRRRVKAYIMAVAILIAVMVGLSRVYLAVHWPTDVIAGWMVGATWALICWSAAVRLQKRGAVEGEAAAGNSDGSEPANDWTIR